MFHYLILYVIVQKETLASQLVSTSFDQATLFTSADGWEILQGNTNSFTLCGAKALFGGYQGFDTQTAVLKYFKLPPHYQIRISFELVVIDMTQSENVFSNIDQWQQVLGIPMPSVDTCASSQPDQSYLINHIQLHYHPTTIISIFTTLSLSSVYWGIRDFKLSIDECPLGCQICKESNSRIECVQWKFFYQQWSTLDINDFQVNDWNEYQITGASTCAGLPIIGGFQKMSLNGKINKQFQLPIHTKVTFFFREFFIDNWTGERAIFRLGTQNRFQMEFLNEQKNLCGFGFSDSTFSNGISIVHNTDTLDVEISSEILTSSDRFLGIRDFSIYIYKPGIICGDGFLNDEEMCDDGNLDPFDGCHNCQITCLDGCSECINGLCVNCISGFIYNEIQNSCEYQFQIEVNQIIELQNQVLDINCVQIYQQNYCLACKIGFELQNNNQCVPICGDGIIVSTEQCDNNQQNCNNCKLQCQLECLQCKFGKCLKCQDGYELFNNQYCKPKCGDLVIRKDEQCDDGNDIRYDGCYQCQNDCQTSCLLCNVGQCWLCDDGWILNDGKCESICGDSLIAIGQEECDDGNNLKNDGCYDCKIECYKNCRNCQQGICQDECGQGEYLFNNYICDSICGDGIVAKNEMCEDENTIQFDGCFNCQYSCPLYCDNCYEGICYQCIDGFELNDKQCFPSCGDGKIAFPYEECDDFNQVDLDGCDKNCEIEPDWICQNFQNTQSECSYSESPQMILTLLKQKYDTFTIELTFTQQISCDVANFTQFIKVQLLNVSIEKYEIKIDQNTPINQTLQFSQIIFTLRFLEQYDSNFIFRVSLEQPVYNEYGLKLKNANSQLKLKQPQVLSYIELDIAQKLKNYNLIILLISCILGLIYLITRKINLFFQTLDILQQQSFYKFINVDIPQNLYIYYESSEVISLQSLLKYFFNFDNLNQNVFQLQVLEPKYKFLEYELNADIVQNLQNIIVFIAFVPILLQIFKLFSKLLFSVQIDIQQKIKFYIYSLATNLSFQLFKDFVKSGLEVITYTNGFDLFFFSFLQLNVFADYYRQLIAILTALITISVTINTKQDKIKRMMILIKKTSFLASLVFLQSNQIIQSLLLAQFQTIHLFYLISSIKKSTLPNFIKNYNSDICYILVVVLNICYWKELSDKISYQNRIILAWVQIALLSQPLFQLLVLEIVRSISFFYQKFLLIFTKKPIKPLLHQFYACKL